MGEDFGPVEADGQVGEVVGLGGEGAEGVAGFEEGLEDGVACLLCGCQDQRCLFQKETKVTQL